MVLKIQEVYWTSPSKFITLRSAEKQTAVRLIKNCTIWHFTKWDAFRSGISVDQHKISISNWDWSDWNLIAESIHSERDLVVTNS